ncbi:MAG: hypothetical protein EOP51_10270 [Sphingobacteriales bacterium]|nr:MAG: hypothetical protein EOP51_10270 [Sphingobacteriales bacterium]
MSYRKFTDEELMEAYNTMHDYSGKIEKNLEAEIVDRGGLNAIKSRLKEQHKIPDEILRIRKATIKLHAEKQTGRIIIASDILNADEVDKIIADTLVGIKNIESDREISTSTILRGAIGMLLSIVLGSGIWWYSIISTGSMYYILLAPIAILSYLIIKGCTGQSSQNVAVFIFTFLAGFASVVLGSLLVKLCI